MEFALADLDAAATLRHAEAVVRRRRAAEVEDLLLLTHWAALHSPTGAPGERVVRPGGDGTPELLDLATAEIALARGVHPITCDRAMADALDLQHRLPATWAHVVALEAEAWVARKVATMTRALPADRVGLVDAAIARAICGQSPARVFAICEAKVIEADPDTHAEKVEAERRRRFVGLGRRDECGLRHVIARLDAVDAELVDATVQRVAEILASRQTDERASTDELRATGFAMLARPAELLELLLDADGPASLDLLRALRTHDLKALRPRAVLHVHLHGEVLDGEPGVARIEGIGPALPEVLLAQLAQSTRVTVAPVIDLADAVSTHAYEHPESIADRVHLGAGGDYFPYANSTTRSTDLDHVVPYDADGPPGQTGTHNAGPLTRRHHRIKTHAGFHARQLGPGHYVWTTPHGRHYLVTPAGTRPLSEAAVRTTPRMAPPLARLAMAG